MRRQGLTCGVLHEFQKKRGSLVEGPSNKDYIGVHLRVPCLQKTCGVLHVCGHLYRGFNCFGSIDGLNFDTYPDRARSAACLALNSYPAARLLITRPSQKAYKQLHL